MLLFHPGLLLCLVLVSLAWPLGAGVARVWAGVLVAGYAYLVLVPLKLSRSTRQPRQLKVTLGLLVSLVVTLGLFIFVMDRWQASVWLRWPAAFITSYYAGALLTVLLLLGTPRGDATRP